MSDPHASQRPSQPAITPDQAFGVRVRRMAVAQCEKLLGTAQGQQAAQRITMAILGAMQAARDPSAFHACTDLSLANCISLSAQTGLLPGGAYPPVYLVPQAARSGEPPELQWRINHRGISILAYRSGFALRSVPVQNDEFLRVSLGEVVEHVGSTSADWPRKLEDLAGVAVVVRDLERGTDVIRAFVPRAVVEARRAKARTRAVWDAWPVEMAQGAAIRYLIARGGIPIDSPELSAALGADEREDERPVVETTAMPARVTGGRAALGLPASSDVPTPDFRAEAEALRNRETVPAASSAQEPTAVAPAPESPPPAVSPPPADLAEVKRRCAALEEELLALDSTMSAEIRAGLGIPAGPIVSWRGHPEAAQRYAQELRAAIDGLAGRQPGEDREDDGGMP
ncbi:MAG: recombinase RecT [Myxococcota bacterium]|nr:recombinase RecT [Myxococcota bacterium]